MSACGFQLKNMSNLLELCKHYVRQLSNVTKDTRLNKENFVTTNPFLSKHFRTVSARSLAGSAQPMLCPFVRSVSPRKRTVFNEQTYKPVSQAFDLQKGKQRPIKGAKFFASVL